MASIRSAVPFTVLLYSDDTTIRDSMRLAVGHRPAVDLAPVRFLEADSASKVISIVDAGEVDLLLLDAEAQPTGGMALVRQIRTEITNPPAMCVVLARKVDAWLATWSQADAYLTHPLDPAETARVVTQLLRHRTETAAAR